MGLSNKIIVNYVGQVPIIGPLFSAIVDHMLQVENDKKIKVETIQENEMFFGPLNGYMTDWAYRADKVLRGIPVYDDALEFIDDQISESMIELIDLYDNNIIPLIDSNAHYIRDKELRCLFIDFSNYTREIFGSHPDEISQNLGTTENQTQFVKSGIAIYYLINERIRGEDYLSKDLDDYLLILFENDNPEKCM